MCTYPLLQQEHKQKGLIPIIPLLHVKKPLQQHKNKNKGLLPKGPVLHMYIFSTTKET